MAPRKGWFPVPRHALALLRENLGEGHRPATLVFLALCDLCNEGRSDTFDATLGIIGHRAGVSRSTACKGLALCKNYGLVTSRQNKAGRMLEANTYTLNVVSEPKPPKNTTPSVKTRASKTTEGINKPSLKREGSIEIKNLIKRSAAFPAPPSPDGGGPEAASERTGHANGGHTCPAVDPNSWEGIHQP